MKRLVAVILLSVMVLSSCGTVNVTVTLAEEAAHIEIETDHARLKAAAAAAEAMASRAMGSKAMAAKAGNEKFEIETVENPEVSDSVKLSSDEDTPVTVTEYESVGTMLGSAYAVSSARMLVGSETEETAAEAETASAAETASEAETVPAAETAVEVETPAAPVVEVHQHAFAEIGRTASTCVSQGSVVYGCACGETQTEMLPLTDHTPAEVVAVQATCQSTGIVNTACAVCGMVFSSVETPVTGHIPGDWVTTVAPTTTSEGVTAQFCTCCGEMLAESWVAPLPTVDTGAYCQQVLALVNANRAAVGLPALAWSQAAANAAAIRAQESVAFFDHIRPDGRAWYTILDETGVPYMTAGENLAAGQMTPEAVVAAWMNSPDHYANLMNPSFTQLGIGLTVCAGYGLYWVQIFTD